MKKRIVLCLSMMIGIIVNGQIAIGKEATNLSALLDFKEGTTSGIILPKINFITSYNLYNDPLKQPGMIYYNSLLQVIGYETNNGFKVLSQRSSERPAEVPRSEVGNGVIIGAGSSVASGRGVLILESDNKALLLPKVENAYNRIKSPEIGTLVYDPTNKVLCVYNGERWSFLTN